MSTRGDLPGKETLSTPRVRDREADKGRAIFCALSWSFAGLSGPLNQSTCRRRVLLTFEVDVLFLREDNVFPRRNSEDPGFLVLVNNSDGVNSTSNAVGISVGPKTLVLDYEALVFVAEEADMVFLENDGHDRRYLF